MDHAAATAGAEVRIVGQVVEVRAQLDGLESAHAGTTLAAAKSAIAVTIEAGPEGARVSYSAPGARLDRILGAIAEAAGFRLAIRGDLSRPAQATRISTVPLDRAIRRLAGNTSMVMIFDPESSGGRRVAEVRLYARP